MHPTTDPQIYEAKMDRIEGKNKQFYNNSWRFQYPAFLKINLSIYLFIAALGLCCCAQAFFSRGKQGLLFVAVHRFLIAVASLVADHGL